jgi:hypothetical protein
MPLGAFKQWRGVMATLHRGNPRHIRMEPWVDWLLCCSMSLACTCCLCCIKLASPALSYPMIWIPHDLDSPAGCLIHHSGVQPWSHMHPALAGSVCGHAAVSSRDQRGPRCMLCIS